MTKTYDNIQNMKFVQVDKNERSIFILLILIKKCIFDNEKNNSVLKNFITRCKKGKFYTPAKNSFVKFTNDMTLLHTQQNKLVIFTR